ncbi:MAG: transcription factor IIA, alpha/beta subunit [Benjaminiella poitrasii]|nr:MAG: transcription factor IIA, alpha/beta subunit [Benjaminiella poitrasii]
MSNAIVSNVYRYVIDDVINQVRGDFEDMGIDDSILQELQRSWESKVARSRVANFGFKEEGYYEDEGGVDVSQNNDQQQQYAEYNSATNGAAPPPPAASLPNLAVSAASAAAAAQNNNRPSQPEQQQLQLPPPPPPQQPQQQYNMSQTSNNRGGMMPEAVNQYQMMQPPRPQQQQNNFPDLYLPGIQRPSNNANNNHLPQNDGANDTDHSLLTTKEIDEHIENMIMQSSQEDNTISFTASTKSGEPIDLESLPDNVKRLMKQVKENATTKKKHRSISQLDGESSDEKERGEETVHNTKDDEDINSDLDDSDEDDEDGEGGEEIEHIILCLYDKVTRTKNKWKCILKDGIMLVNGRDYLFHRANGDFEW